MRSATGASGCNNIVQAVAIDIARGHKDAAREKWVVGKKAAYRTW